jgi:hypothetical protein
MNTADMKVSVTLTGEEMEQFLSMKRDLADADRINGELTNEIESLKRSNNALSNRVDFLEKRIVKIHRAQRKMMEAAADTTADGGDEHGPGR